MSIYRKLTPFIDLSCLEEALRRLGIPHEKAQGSQLVTYYSWAGRTERGQADLVIRQVHISGGVGDMGFLRDPVTGKVTVDADLAHGDAPQKYNRIMQMHSRILVERAAQRAGFRLVEQPGKGRVLRLQAHPLDSGRRLEPVRRALRG